MFYYSRQPSPLLLIPSSFTRFEKPICYAYTDKRYPDRSSPEHGDSVHNKTRMLRGSQVSPYIFNLTDDLPSEPHEIYLKQKEIKFDLQPRLVEEYEVIRKVCYFYYINNTLVKVLGYFFFLI